MKSEQNNNCLLSIKRVVTTGDGTIEILVELCSCLEDEREKQQ